MKWEIGQKVSYIYHPSVGDNVEYSGVIVNIKDGGVCIKWKTMESVECYSFKSYIVRHLILIPELPKDNPNRTFAQNQRGLL